jgi:protein-S-isoprenylcysteine O-methyltransferase Ste14
VVLLLKNLLFTIVAPGTVAMLIPWLLIRHEFAPPGISSMIGAILFGLGGAIYAWCVWDFAAFGRGTPAPIDAPKKLVVRGLYHFVRNPMYLGVLTVIAAWAVLYRAAELFGYLAVVATCFHIFILLYEEPHLERVFGAEYSAYKSRVGRWLPRHSGRPDA